MTRRSLIIYHPKFDGPQGVKEAKDFAETLIAGFDAAAQDNGEAMRKQGIPAAEVERYLIDNKAFKILIRKLDEDIF